MIINWIITFGSCPLISSLSSICGIAGFIFSVIIWAKTKKLQDEINIYKRNQKKIENNLKAYRDSIIQDELYTLNIRSSVRTELYSILQGYGTLFSPYVKYKIRKTIRLLNTQKNTIDQEKLCDLLDWIIARIGRKENRS